jgi:hypothetical protein
LSAANLANLSNELKPASFADQSKNLSSRPKQRGFFFHAELWRRAAEWRDLGLIVTTASIA